MMNNMYSYYKLATNEGPLKQRDQKKSSPTNLPIHVPIGLVSTIQVFLRIQIPQENYKLLISRTSDLGHPARIPCKQSIITALKRSLIKHAN